MWLLAVDGVLGVVDIENEIDAGVIELLHTLVVVKSVVDSVYSNGVDSKILESGDIALANLGIGEGILVGRRTTGLVVNTSDVEAGVASPESYNASVSLQCRFAYRQVQSVPFPEAETTGRLARLLGGSLTVGVAETEPMAARAETRVKVFIVIDCDERGMSVGSVIISGYRRARRCIIELGGDAGFPKRVREIELQLLD